MALLSNTFKSDSFTLRDFLRDLYEGQLQMPDFQRDWTWDEDRIRSLIASVSLGFPIGSVLVLEAGNTSMKFGVRNIVTAPKRDASHAKLLLLDGQQRLTSLYLALKAEHTQEELGKKRAKRIKVYYLNIRKCLDGAAEREDAVTSRRLIRDISDLKRDFEPDNSVNKAEYEQGIFPLHLLFDDRRVRWMDGYKKFHTDNKERLAEIETLSEKILNPMLEYKIPVTIISSSAGRESVCRMFETLNNRGVNLTVFDLLTARYAGEEFGLRDDWDSRRNRLGKRGIFEKLRGIDFLTAVALTCSYRQHVVAKGAEGEQKVSPVSIKRADILALEKLVYESAAEEVHQGFEQAREFLRSEGIYARTDIPYSTQLIPLAAILAQIGDGIGEEAFRKLSRWFWCGVFSNRYAGATASRSAEDIVSVVPWVAGDGDVPDSVRGASIIGTEIISQSRASNASFKGAMALMKKAAFQSLEVASKTIASISRTGDIAIEYHHIFPTSYGDVSAIKKKYLDSVVNLTPLPKGENQAIGGVAPAKYIPKLAKQYGISVQELSARLATHMISVEDAQNNDFGQFYRLRAKRLLELVGAAVGKEVWDAGSPELESFLAGASAT